ncbi:MAG: hypothetical protein QG608_773 [Actinomycetota bacterium]|nr:hypothetical protein [Actinomycetota bacterium]
MNASESCARGDLLSLESFTDACTLNDIIYYEISVRRTQPASSVPPAPEGGDQDSNAAHHEVQLMSRVVDGTLEIRARLDMTGPEAEATVDASALFSLSDPSLSPSEELQMEFARRVGIMVIYPYLREALHQSVAKLRVESPMLALLRAGQFSLSDNAPEA